MQHHRMVLAALAASILSAGHALAVQETSRGADAPTRHFAQMESFSASELVAELIGLEAATQGRIAFRDPGGLLERLETKHAQLTALADADGSRWGMGFEIFFSTNTPEPRPCNDHTPVMVISRQGTEMIGTACRLYSIEDGVPMLTVDQLLDAPFEGHVLHIHLITSIGAEQDSLLDSGNEILAAMAIDVLQALTTASPETAGEDWEQWLNLLQVMTERANGLIRFETPNAVAHALDAATAEVQEAADVLESDWGFTFGIDGAQAVAVDGQFDADRLAAARRPETAAWCLTDLSFVVSGPSGSTQVWQQCSGTPAEENPESLIIRKVWTEESSTQAYRWLELTAVGSTDTPAQLPALDSLARQALIILANDIMIGPDAAAGSEE